MNTGKAVGRLVGCLLALVSVGVRPVAPPPVLAQGDAPASLADPDTRWLDLVQAAPQPEPDRAQAVGDLTLHLHLTDNTLAGRALAPGRVEAWLVRAGVEQGRWSMDAINDGARALYLGQALVPVVAGDQLWVRQSTDVVSLTVPALSALAWDQTDVVSGEAPAFATLQSYLFPFGSQSVFSQTAPAGGDGRFSIGFSHPIQPRDSGMVIVNASPVTSTAVRFVTPFLSLALEGDDVSGFGPPNSSAGLQVQRSGQLVSLWSLVTDRLGAITWLPNFSEERVRLRAGDQIVADFGAQLVQLTVPTLSAGLDLSTGNVSGLAGPGALITATVFAGPVPAPGSAGRDLPTGDLLAQADGQGRWALPRALTPPEYARVAVSGGAGHELYQRLSTFALTVRVATQSYPQIDSPIPPGSVRGQTAPGPGTLTMTVRSADGALRLEDSIALSAQGYFERLDYGMVFAPSPGDTLSFVSDTSAYTVTLPDFRVTYDAVSGLGGGEITPNTRARIRLYEPYQELINDVEVQADADGRFSFDGGAIARSRPVVLADLEFSPRPGLTVFASTVEITSLRCGPRLYAAELESSRLVVGTDVVCDPRGSNDPIRVQIFNPQGGLRLDHLAQSSYVVLDQVAGQRFVLNTGDEIVLTAAELIERYRVPRLEASLSPDRNRLVGWVEPGTRPIVTFSSLALESYESLELSPGPDGSFSQLSTPQQPFDLPGVVRLYAPGAVFQRLVVMEGIVATAGARSAFVLMASPEPYTLTTTAPDGETRRDVLTHEFSAGEAVEFPDQKWTAPGTRLLLEGPSGSRTLTITELTLELDRTARTIAGQGPALSRLGVALRVDGQALATHTSGATGHDGRYQIPLRAISPAGDAPSLPVFSMSVAVADADGDLIQIRGQNLNAQVGLGQSCFYPGQPPLADAQARLESAQGALKAEGVLSEGHPLTLCFPGTPIAAGDRITYRTERGRLSLPVPALDLTLDRQTGAIVGFAPPGATLVVARYPRDDPHGWRFERLGQGTADATGRIVIPLNGYRSAPDFFLRVSYAVPEGDAFSLDLDVVYPIWLPVVLGPRP